MRTLLALTTLLLAPVAALAQSNLTLDAPTSQSCPIGVTAQHSPQGAVEQVLSNRDHYHLAYNITLRSFDTRLIAQARITLRGLSGAQITPASISSTPESNATETFTLSPGASPKPTFDSVVYTAKLTGVRFIEVDAVTYTDGTQWHQSPGNICRIAPNNFLLVNASAN